MSQNIGFNIKKEFNEQSTKDWLFGAKKISGIADKVAGLITAVYAWSTPVNGIYPKVRNALNHAIDMISEACKKYLPFGTIQRGREDWMNCASNAPANELEKQHNYALDNGLFSQELVDWFKKVGFINSANGKFEIADAFVSQGSGTTRSGNSLKAPLEFIRTHGIIPKSMLPDDPVNSLNNIPAKRL